MAGGPILPSSVYLGAASGNLSPQFYAPSTATNLSGYLEGIGVVASLSSGSTTQAMLHFNLPESLPTGTAKLRLLASSNATTGNALFTVNDAVFAAGSIMTSTALIAETQVTQTWSTADALVENKVTLSSTMVANSVLACRLDFNSTGSWTLAATSVWQPSLVWE